MISGDYCIEVRIVSRSARKRSKKKVVGSDDGLYRVNPHRTDSDLVFFLLDTYIVSYCICKKYCMCVTNITRVNFILLYKCLHFFSTTKKNYSKSSNEVFYVSGRLGLCFDRKFYTNILKIITFIIFSLALKIFLRSTEDQIQASPTIPML